MLALVQASGLIGSHSSFESSFGQFLFEQILQLGLRIGVATAARMPWRPLIAADKNVLLKLGHEETVQDFKHWGDQWSTRWRVGANRGAGAGGRKSFLKASPAAGAESRASPFAG